MRISHEEIAQPAEWLRGVLTQDDEFLRLLHASGGLAQAAYRLARAQCRASGQGHRQPTLGELRLAARMVALRTGRSPDLSIMPASAFGSKPSSGAAPSIRRPPAPSRRVAS